MSEKPPQLDSLFLAALEIESPNERAVFLDRSCGDDQQLREEIELLLRSHQAAGGFLEKPAPELDATMVQDGTGKDLAEAMQAGLASAFTASEAVVIGNAGHSVLRTLGQTIDIPRVALREANGEGEDPIARPASPEIPNQEAGSRYQLQGEIARGGMGAIIKGRDTDLGRDLAIKVLLESHKDQPEVIQRFVEEAQIGGQLQHPGIAPVYELGQFADQRPFFSMKLVKGETLSKLLADRRDPADERGRFLGIFEQICQTMAYAHSRGVIHRDLKPANIMVGAFGEVQVMDWGLAKVLSAGGVADEKRAQSKHKDVSVIETRRSVGSDTPGRAGSVGSVGSQTRMGSVMGTPAYMPPEQALGEIDQLDQRADVFGLGAILCEILTGQPPYVGDDGTQVFRMASRGKLDDAFARLGSCDADPELISLTKHCLAVEPGDRPQDAGALAERVSGYLESVESKLRQTEMERGIEAARVVEQKKRLFISLALAATALLVLACGIAGTAWQAHRAEQARAAEARRAEGERLAKLDAQAARDSAEAAAEKEQAANAQAQKRLAQIEKANEILGSIFANLDPKEIARNERPLQAILVEKLDKAVEQLEGESIGDPLVVAKMQNKFGLSLLGLGKPDKAILLLEKALATRSDALGPEHPDTLTSIRNLAYAYQDAGKLDKALSLYEQTLKLFRATLGPEHLSTLGSMNNLAGAYQAVGQLDKALPLLEQTLKLVKAKLGPEHPHTLASMNNLAGAYQTVGQRDKALPLYEQTLKLVKTHFGLQHPHTLTSMHNLGNAYQAAGQWERALPLYEETLKLSKATLGPEHPDTLSSMNSLGLAYKDASQLEKALPLLEQTLKLIKARLGPEHPHTLTSMNNLAGAYQAVGQRDKALPLYEQTLKLAKAQFGLQHPDTLTSMHNLGNAYRAAGQWERALPLLEETLKFRKSKLGPEHPDTLANMASLGLAMLKVRAPAKAEPLLRECLAARERELPDSWLTFNTQSILGGALLGQKKYEAAETMLLKGYQGMKAREETIPGRGLISLDEGLQRLVELYQATGKKEEAAKWRAELDQRQAAKDSTKAARPAEPTSDSPLQEDGK